MSSSPFQSTNQADSSENLQNLRQLPYFTLNPILVDSHTPILHQTIDFNAAFVQIQIPREQINNKTIQDLSFSSLPELIPNLDFILSTHPENPGFIPRTDREVDQTPDLFHISPTIDLDPFETILDTYSNDFLPDPPPYSQSEEDLPEYQQPWRRDIILRRIRILQSEATALYRQVDQQRSEQIAIYNAAVNTQLRERDLQYAMIIDHLKDLLDLWQ